MIRKRRRSTRSTLLAAALLAPAILTVGTTTSTAASPSLAAAPTVTGTVTLLTGDRVSLGRTNTPRETGSGADIQPAPGREKIRFLQTKDQRGDLSVIPTDMQLGVSQGRLDPRLFNVTQLIRDGYDDRTRADIPLIVSGGQCPGIRATRQLASVGAIAVRVDKKPDQARTFLSATADAERIWLDGPVKATLDQSVPQIGAPEAWRAGHTGKGATVAVLDTGIGTEHPDLATAPTSPRSSPGSTASTRASHRTRRCSTARSSTTPAADRSHRSSPGWNGPRPAPTWST